jgi:hypothetical protein
MTASRSPAPAPTATRDRGQAADAAMRRPPRGPCYVYGIVPSTAAVPAGLRGLADHFSGVDLIPHHRAAAAVSRLSADRRLGTAADLRAHFAVLDALASCAPVLPMRFGAVLPGERAVIAELLEPLHATFADRLDHLTGQAQFTIKGRYLGDIALREVLAENPECMRLRARLRGRDLELHRGEGIQLGALIAAALESKQAADTRTLTVTLAPYSTAVAQHQRSSPESAVDAAFLVARSRQRAFEDAVEKLGEGWQHRIRMRLLGPLAPYDFAQPIERRA